MAASQASVRFFFFCSVFFFFSMKPCRDCTPRGVRDASIDFSRRWFFLSESRLVMSVCSIVRSFVFLEGGVVIIMVRLVILSFGFVVLSFESVFCLRAGVTLSKYGAFSFECNAGL